MKQLISTITILIAFGTLGGCGDDSDRDIRVRKYIEVGCWGFLENVKDGKYKCVRLDNDEDEQVDLNKPSNEHRTVTVNRRTGTVAFDGRLVGECRVADFDAWECVERVPIRGALGRYDSIHYRTGRKNGGYIEEWCSATPDAPAVRSVENCKGPQRYYGIPVSGFSLKALLCSTSSYTFCKFL
jgi:hypothetical protein